MLRTSKKERSHDIAARLKAIVESAVDGIITINTEGLIESVNPAACQLFGYTEGELCGNNISMLMPSPHQESHDEYVQNYLSTGISKIIGRGREVMGKKKDETVFPFWLSVSTFRIKNQQMFTGVVHDMSNQRMAETALNKINQQLENIVSERTEKLSELVNRLLSSKQLLEHEIEERIAAENAYTQSQQEVQKTERLLQQIVKNFPDGVISVLDQDLHVVFCGGEFHHALKTLSKELIGKRFYALLSDETWESLKPELIKVFAGENLLDFEVPEKVLNHYFMFDAVPLHEPDGSVPRIAVYARAITKMKQIEGELRESLKKEQELGLMKNRFVSMASHEFRTPLSTILSSASLMVQYTQTEQQDKRERHFKKIKAAVDMLTAILNDFLSLGRLEEGAVVLHNETFDIHTFCHETMDDIHGILKHGQIVKIQQKGNKNEVHLDKKILKLILTNLISNASKYSKEDAEIDCYIDTNKDTVKISITDKGIGIPEEEQKYLFDRFFRASNATNINGTGLGLHIVKRYVELMKGEVSCKSRSGKGSTFTIQFKT